MIYLDNAATTLKKPDSVIDAVCHALKHFGNSGRGAHESSLDASRIIFDARRLVAELFGAPDPGRVIFTANATMALNMVIQGLLCPGDHVITSEMEHNSVLRPLYAMEERGVELTILPADVKGNISLSELEANIRSNTRLVALTHASNLTGNVNDIKGVGDICERHGLMFLLDASQTAGVLPIDMEHMHITALCFTGHKSLMGPQGTGGLCLGRDVDIRPLMYGGTGIKSHLKTQPKDLPEHLEAGTLNGHGIAGLHAALLWRRQMGDQKPRADEIREQELSLMWQFYDGVSKIPGVTVYGSFDRERDRAPIVALNIKDWDSGEAADVLMMDYGIQVRSGAHCAPLMHKALGTGKQGAVRFSFSCFNTEEEISEAVRAIEELAAD